MKSKWGCEMKRAVEIVAFLLCTLVLAGAANAERSTWSPTAQQAQSASCVAAKRAVTRFKRAMAKQRTAYFKTHQATKARKAFLKRQKAKLILLQKAAKRACQSACVRANAAVADYKRQMAKERKAFFKRHTKARARKAFLKRQQTKLKRRQRAAAAACRVPGQTPPPPPAPPAPPPAPPAPPSTDRDGDGSPNGQDCSPDDAAIHPGAPDAPDLAFVDSNCDGIDGTESTSVFVSPLGDDGNPGTKAAPMREINAAVAAAAAAGKQHVYAQGGTYARVAITGSGIRLYGGYSSDWSRSLASATSIVGESEGMLLVNAAEVLLQHLTVRGNARAGSGESAYGMRLTENSSATLQRVFVSAGNGWNGVSRPAGASGGQAAGGGDGKKGACGDEGDFGYGGSGGASAVGRAGGHGGDGGWFNGPDPGDDGGTGQIGTQGGAGGGTGDPGADGDHGDDGANGSGGANGTGGTSATTLAATDWVGEGGASGAQGAHGMGGGGGGGGGAQDCASCWPGTGNGGGGGGAGGPRGTAGGGGGAGGGSFGLYLHYSTVVVSDGSSITPGDGGTGGRGGAGGSGGLGGAGGLGAAECPDEVGIGGNGGDGGHGGHGGGGGGGAGGPSIGIFKLSSHLTVVGSSTVTNALAGWGGEGGTGPASTGAGGIGARGIAQPIYPGPAVPATGQLSWDSCFANDSTQGCIDVPGTPLHVARAVAFSPDGTSVYAASQDSHSLARFVRGANVIAWGGCWAYSSSEGCVAGHALSAPRGLAVSPDGKSVYVANVFGNSIAHFVRNELDGQVTWDDCFANDATLGCFNLPSSPLSGASGVAVSPDGKSVYVASSDSNSIAHFFRRKVVREDPDGQLAWDGCLADDGTQGCVDLPGTPLTDASGVAVSPDGKSVYVVAHDSNTIALFVRSGPEGQLEWGGCLTNELTLPCNGVPGSPLTGATGVAVSPDGKSVYVVSRLSGSITHFSRNPFGGVTFEGCLANDPATGCDNLPGSPLRGAAGVAVSPDGKSVYVASPDSNSTANFLRSGADGQIVYDGCWANDTTDGCFDLPGSPLTGARGVAVSPDGKSAYVASGGSNSVAQFLRTLAP